ncbi:GNAT family N-acetyltransferase [Pseudomonas capeferrum]|uniref:GNAT family N-acetyltransferase n=1 Tax=Pseudomonas capeferrum TaxID=1495066 RepID=UPI0015E27356|nr:GNAT family N-acetyltransferase [Pseudomonas capeferrum]MBA1200745.1 GNAT family N-acetyltransferase [Pseudomonas capeferrum]
MRAVGEGTLWMARDKEIIAGLNLGPVPGGQWLTGLFVAPSRRGQGVAAHLIEAALNDVGIPTWLFCHPDLEPFYRRNGFRLADRLPAVLAERLSRYQRSKPLIALTRLQSSLTSSPGNSTSV